MRLHAVLLIETAFSSSAKMRVSSLFRMYSACPKDGSRAAPIQRLNASMQNGEIKVAAGQLIERCGWKGRALGRAAVHARHALVIINNGNACGADILKL